MPPAASPPTVFGEESSFRLAKSFNPKPALLQQYQHGGQNTECPGTRRLWGPEEQHNGAHVAVGETEARASAEMGVSLWELRRPEEYEFSSCPLVISYLNFSPFVNILGGWGFEGV